MARLIAALANRYRVERELGAGGMATVYLAHDLRHDRKVAVKVLREELSASLGKERFLREIKVAAALQHPHILPLYDSGAADGLLFYVMPYVDGLSLREKLVKEGELPIGDAVRILRDIADALSEAHRHGVVHRDLKPENVMLRGRHALVMDFGVAKALSDATGRQSLTTLGVALGTPTYMAPEQAVADPHVDHRADLYAFGVVAYELLAARPPFTGTSPQQILAAHVTAAAEPVTTHRVMPAPLAALVMRCLEKRPADRWQSAEELITRLEAVPTLDSATAACQALRRLAADNCDERLLIQQGRAAEVVAARRTRPPTDPADMLNVAEALARAGDTARGRRQLSAALAAAGSRYVREDYVAGVYLALGDTARTLEWLERGLDAQAANMAQINRAWRFKPLHGNPGFAAIVRKAGLRLRP